MNSKFRFKVNKLIRVLWDNHFFFHIFFHDVWTVLCHWSNTISTFMHPWYNKSCEQLRIASKSYGTYNKFFFFDKLSSLENNNQVILGIWLSPSKPIQKIILAVLSNSSSFHSSTSNIKSAPTNLPNLPLSRVVRFPPLT